MNDEPVKITQEDKKEKAPLASIVVLAYNHLEYTKQCIESIYRYTSHIDFELITIDNGCSDGTREYFESLLNKKKISFPENIGVCKAFNSGFKIAEGKYILNISNDIVVTTHWLDNLLICMDTDPKIGMVVPICDASCNYQQITLPYQTMDEMQSAAERYNISNPDLWEERLKLSNYAGIYRGELLKALGGFDEDFNPGSYDDDAICFSIRRIGYKVILAKDTFVHHFGARTFNEEYEKDKNLLIRNKSLFIRKFGVNPYVAGTIDYNVLNLLSYSGAYNVDILGIGRSYGTTVLQLKNTCRSHGSKNVRLYYLSEQMYNMVELRTICNECICAPIKDIQLYFASRLYDYIIVESSFDSLPDKEDFFTDLYRHLKADGKIVCTAPNQAALYEIMGIFSRLGANFDGQIHYYYLCFSKPV
nr:glycosyltransferase [uncultured Caproiciproducens sp.]